MKKALIIDLDNTIYPVSSIADHLFAGLFAILDEYSERINAGDAGRVSNIKREMMRKPFQHIAEEFSLDSEIRKLMIDALKNMSYDQPMQTFDDYKHIRSIQLDKYLVTTGFTKLQWSKVKMLGIEQDFKAIYIADPELGSRTKKDIFAEIMQIHGYRPEELLVIGDDPESEIKAAKALGIDTVLYDHQHSCPDAAATHKIRDLKEVVNILQ
jgi:putative hydrolase of the HAD superfamily